MVLVKMNLVHAKGACFLVKLVPSAVDPGPFVPASVARSSAAARNRVGTMS